MHDNPNKISINMNKYYCFITSICIVNMAWLGLYA